MRQSLYWALALLVVLVAGWLVLACKPAEHPRHTLRASVLGIAAGVKALDVTCAESARTLKNVALAEKCAASYRVARESLLAAEAALDSWQAADQRQVGCLAGKAARALLEGVHAAKSAGVALPNAVADGAQLAEILVPIAEGACPQ